jgi:hypothetical protein
MKGRAAILAGALLCWAAASYGAASYRSPFPAPSELRAPAGGAGGDMLALALGARRVFADLWFVRLMQYYGSREFKEVARTPGHEGHEHRVDEHGHHHCDHGKDYGKGAYPLFLPMARHILDMDPYFTAAGLYGAACLAFNMNRAGDAEELLRHGLRYSPKEWKYLSVLAAVGYSKAENPAAVAETIAPLLKEPDCPVMLKQLAAFLNKKAGNFAAAAAIYADIAATSRDEFYVKNARRELERFASLGHTGNR